MRRLITILLVVVALFPLTATATVRGVPDPYSTIQEGIDAANPGDTVLVAPGTYTGDGNRDLDFRGKAIVVMSEERPEVTIIDCEGSESEPHRGFYFHTDEDSSSVVQGFTITGGLMTRPEPLDRGGAIYCYYSSPTITGNIIHSCGAIYTGGILCWYSPAIIVGNTFQWNRGVGYGGAIACYASAARIAGNSFEGNSSGSGGAVDCNGRPSPKVIDNTFKENYATYYGGAISFTTICTTHAVGNTLTENTAGGWGGGVACLFGSSPTVLNSILWCDTAWREGNEIYVDTTSSIDVRYSDVKGGWEGEGNINADPMFCDPANQAFTLHIDSPCVGSGQNGANMGAWGVGCGLRLTIVRGDTVVAHRDTLCYHLICENGSSGYLSLWFKVDVRLPNGSMYGPIFGPARFGMFGNGISEGDMCHIVPPQAPVGDYWLFAEVYNLEVSAADSMAFAVTGDGKLAGLESPFGEWQTVVARLGDQDLLGGGVDSGTPTQFALQGNYPNPFNAKTVIDYQLPEASDVKLEVYNTLGQKVATLIDEKQEAGYKSAAWDASEISSGLYFYKLTAGDFTETKRMMLVK